MTELSEKNIATDEQEQQNLRLLEPPVADVASGGEPDFFLEQACERGAGDSESVADHVEVEVAVG